MLIGFGIATGLAVVFFIARFASQGSKLSDAVDQVRRTEHPGPVVELVEEAPADKRPAMWDQAIGDLWNAYAREEAACLVMAAARRSDATILQYWIKQVLEVEPQIAEEIFPESFLQTHYKPRVAARCGKSGCCG